MSDTFLELKLAFTAKDYRDTAMAFLNDEGPTFEEDVDDKYRHMFVLMDDVEPRPIWEAVGEKGLRAYFELYSDGILSARSIMAAATKAGAVEACARFGDVDGNDVYWRVENNRLIAMYSSDEDDEIDRMLLELEDEEKREAIVALYENGKLKGRIDDLP